MHDRLSLSQAHEQRALDAMHRGDATAAVLWLAYAAEAAVDVLADALGADARKSHHRRSSLARRAHEQGLVDEDWGSLIIRLTTERNAAVHDARVPDLRGRTLEEAAAAVGSLVRAAAVAASQTAT